MTARPVRRADVRFYFDADLLGLTKVIDRLRHDITYPGDPGGVVHKRHREPCPITTTDVLDVDWIPEIAGRGWIIITRDANIAARPAEVDAVREYGARVVALAGREAIGKWAQLEILMCQWRGIERLAATTRASIHRATRTSLRPVAL
jgi:hypothetical protein